MGLRVRRDDEEDADKNLRMKVHTQSLEQKDKDTQAVKNKTKKKRRNLWEPLRGWSPCLVPLWGATKSFCGKLPSSCSPAWGTLPWVDSAWPYRVSAGIKRIRQIRWRIHGGHECPLKAYENHTYFAKVNMFFDLLLRKINGIHRFH